MSLIEGLGIALTNFAIVCTVLTIIFVIIKAFSTISVLFTRNKS